LYWVLIIVLDAILLRKGSWGVGARVFSIVMSAFSIALAASFMTHIQYLYTLKGALGQLGAEGILQSLLNQLLIVVFVIVIITSAIKIVQMVWRLVKGTLS
jgi:hypothetical protein